MEVVMKLKRSLQLILLVGLVLTVAACQKESPSAPTPSVKANQAYLTAFGEPPVVAQGSCFARVGYYPLWDAPDQLHAMPFFLFDVQTELPLLFERLVNNPAAFPEGGPLFNPFPPGSRVRVGPMTEVLELALNLEQTPDPQRLDTMAAALTETAGQYPDIKRVNLLLNGSPWPGMPADGFRPDPARIVEPGPPQLLLVIGSWEPGAVSPDEILADFDRPVSIESFTLSDEAGNKLEGEYFTSAFDMAVVLHPQNPAAFQAGMQLSAAWRVTDRLGRSGAGEGRFLLQRHEHAEIH
jgi:Sporulation and spore germination